MTSDPLPKLHGYPLEGDMHNYSSNWDRAHKTTLWRDDQSATFSRVYYHKDGSKLKVHADTLSDSPIPTDPAGFRCVFSFDSKDVDFEDRTRDVAHVSREYTVGAVVSSGRHKILKLD